MRSSLRARAVTEHAPFFIVCTPRSGSTLLRLLLTSHPDLCVPPESMFLVRLYDVFGQHRSMDGETIAEFIDQLYRDVKFVEWGVPREVLHDKLSNARSLSFKKAVSTVYTTYMEQTWPEAKIWGDKNPFYLWHIQKILSVFPNAKFIHILRDVRAVYLSTKKVARLKEAKGLVTEVRQSWILTVSEAKIHESSDRFLSVRYEDLVQEPVPILTKICEFVGVGFDERMLDYYRWNAEKKLVPEHRLVTHHSNTLRPILTGRVNAWRTELSRAELEALEIYCEDLLSELDYDIVTSGVRMKGRTRLIGDCLESVIPQGWSRLKQFLRKTKTRAISKRMSASGWSQ